MIDYYEILGVSRDANSDQLRKAYRKLALQYHPDKNPANPKVAETKFKEVSEAYEVLIDEEKREIFDRYGAEVLKSGRIPHSNSEDDFDDDVMPTFSFVFHDPREVFASFFSGFPGMSSFPFGRRGMGPFGFDPFSSDDDFFGDPFANLTLGGPMHGNMRQSRVSAFGFSPFHEAFGPMGGGSMLSLGPMGSGFGGVSMTSTSTSTQIINGQMVTTRREMANGVETVTVHENGVLVSQTVKDAARGVEAMGGRTNHLAVEGGGGDEPSYGMDLSSGSDGPDARQSSVTSQGDYFTINSRHETASRHYRPLPTNWSSASQRTTCPRPPRNQPNSHNHGRPRHMHQIQSHHNQAHYSQSHHNQAHYNQSQHNQPHYTQLQQSYPGPIRSEGQWQAGSAGDQWQWQMGLEEEPVTNASDPQMHNFGGMANHRRYTQESSAQAPGQSYSYNYYHG